LRELDALVAPAEVHVNHRQLVQEARERHPECSNLQDLMRIEPALRRELLRMPSMAEIMDLYEHSVDVTPAMMRARAQAGHVEEMRFFWGVGPCCTVGRRLGWPHRLHQEVRGGGFL
jgi:hypothetical protein